MPWIWLVIGAIVAAALLAAGVIAGRDRQVKRFRRERQRAENAEEALASRERSSAEERRVQDQILSAMQEGILLFDGDRRLAFANAAFDAFLDHRPGAIQQLLPVAARDLVGRVALSGDAETAEVATGVPTRWLTITATPAGTDGSVLVVIRDITESRRIEVVRRDFVANASHELKTPAASIQAAAETLRDAAQDDPVAAQRFAVQLELDARRLSRIVADLLDLSRLESGSELQDDVFLEDVVDEEAERFEGAVREADLAFAIEAPRVAPVRGSRRDLSLLVRNLIDNAIRYTKPGGEVNVRISDENNEVCLEVADDGSGIPTNDLSRIFERFYRVDRARSRETGGTGLGLAIVKHVAENHGGHVDVRSELGRGSTFVVTLPASPGSSG
jgi:signal transduction histidine kinase